MGGAQAMPTATTNPSPQTAQATVEPFGHVETPPKETGFRLWFSRFMFFPAIGGNFVPLIQAWRIVVNGMSENVSPIAWGFALFCLSCWLTYGFVRRDKVLIWANVVGVINAAILIACIIAYA